LPALDSTAPTRNPRQGPQRKPPPSRSRATPAPVGPRQPLEPRRTQDQTASQPAQPRRRRVNPTLFVSRTPYLDAVMAGARGRFRGRPGRGAPPGRTGAATGADGGAPQPAGDAANQGGRGPADGPGGRGRGPPSAKDGRGGRGGGVLPLRRTAGVAVGEPTLLGLLAVVLLLITVRQPNCNREEAVDVLQLTFRRSFFWGNC
jgi:hypothetical protein